MKKWKRPSLISSSTWPSAPQTAARPPTHYESNLRIFAHQVDKPPCQVTVQHVSAFITGQSSQGLRASTIKRRLATLHRFFEFLAVEAGDEAWANPVVWCHHRIRQGTHLPRDLVRDCPLPWQPAQEQLRPERTLQSLGATFREIGTPAAPPQTRGKSPGWR